MNNFTRKQKLTLHAIRLLPVSLFAAAMLSANAYMTNYNTVEAPTSSLESLSTTEIGNDPTPTLKTPLTASQDLTELLNQYVSDEYKVGWCNKSESCRVLAEAAYHEARSEDEVGVVAVMQVILNRKYSEDRIFARQTSVKSVVYASNQFSYVWDGSRARGMKDKKQVVRMKIMAYDVLNGLIGDITNDSVYYHAGYVRPYWRDHYEYVVTVDNHLFYK